MASRTRIQIAPGTLPDKPSELIRLALGDLERVERSSRYEIDMNKWHDGADADAAMAADYDEAPVCSVCFAGAVMAMSLKQNIRKNLCPFNFDRDTENKLVALDAFRCGMIASGLIALDYSYVARERILYHLGISRYIHPYISDAKKFKQALLELASEFEAAGY